MRRTHDRVALLCGMARDVRYERLPPLSLTPCARALLSVLIYEAPAGQRRAHTGDSEQSRWLRSVTHRVYSCSSSENGTLVL